MSISRSAVLIVEDDEPKLRAITDFLRQEFLAVDIAEARSLSSAISLLSLRRFTAAIVDMSLPTYEVARDRAGGGQPQGFGGEDVLRFIEAEQPTCRSIVLTQYEEFTDKEGQKLSLSDVRRQLSDSVSPPILGVVYYSGPSGEWRKTVRELLVADLAGVSHG